MVQLGGILPLHLLPLYGLVQSFEEGIAENKVFPNSKKGTSKVLSDTR